MKTCPFCAEQIQVDAKKCRDCGEFLERGARRSSQVESPSARTLFPLQRVGVILCALGVTGALYFFAIFDTSVEVPITMVLGHTVGGGRVNNLGLLSERQNGVIICCVVAVVGVILLLVGRITTHGPAIEAQDRPTDITENRKTEALVAALERSVIPHRTTAFEEPYPERREESQAKRFPVLSAIAIGSVVIAAVVAWVMAETK